MKSYRICLSIIGLLLIFSGLAFDTILPLLPIGGALIYSIVDLAVAYYYAKECQVNIIIKGHAQKGTTIDAAITVGGKIPFGGVEVFMKLTNKLTEEIQQERIHISGKDQRADFQLDSKYCGMIEIKIEKILVFDTFKVFKVAVSRPVCGQCLIIPELFPQQLHLRDGWSYDMESTEYSKTRPGDDVSEVFDIREYEKGDSLKRIHWKLTGKYEKLMVMRPSYPMDNRIALIYSNLCEDASARYDQIDKAIEAIVTTSYSLIDNELKHTICWYDRYMETMVQFDIEDKDDIYGILPLILGCGIGDIKKAETISLAFDEYSHIISIGPMNSTFGCNERIGQQTATSIIVGDEARGEMLEDGILKIVTCPRTLQKDLENLYI